MGNGLLDVISSLTQRLFEPCPVSLVTRFRFRDRSDTIIGEEPLWVADGVGRVFS